MAAYPPQPAYLPAASNYQDLQTDPRQFNQGESAQPLISYPPPSSGGPSVPFDLRQGQYQNNPIPPVPAPIGSGSNKILTFAFVAAALVVLVIAIIDLSFSKWLEWCIFDINLTNISDDGGSVTLSDFVTVCNEELSVLYISGCGNLCTVATKFKHSGTAMLILGTLGIVFTGLAALYLLVCVFFRSLKIRLVFKISLLTGITLWLIGTVVYLAIFADVESMASETKLEVGADFAIAVTVLFVLLAALGLFVEKKSDQAVQQQS